ncbi:FG-GAP repeat domain-containing protein [Streptomyces sp. NPDC001820]|uniref:FG-GAP repeat domain-containing protein n=1 Tax=Streptomyces sp. NPDC001820 TaxID=3364613 RepID=UPI00369093BF
MKIDLDRNGYADLLVRTTGGTLQRVPITEGIDTGQRVNLGTGWNRYNKLLVVRDLTGDGKPDLLGREASGQLWLYRGNGAGGFGSRVLIGAGWGQYYAIVGRGDLSGDSVPDLLGGIWRAIYGYTGAMDAEASRRVRKRPRAGRRSTPSSGPATSTTTPPGHRRPDCGRRGLPVQQQRQGQLRLGQAAHVEPLQGLRNPQLTVGRPDSRYPIGCRAASGYAQGCCAEGR